MVLVESIRPGSAMTVHVFDLNETATHELVAAQLRALADQLASGSIDLAYEEFHAPTAVMDPVNVTVDLTQKRHHVELNIDMRWPTPTVA